MRGAAVFSWGLLLVTMCSSLPSIEAQYGPATTTQLTPFPSDRYTVLDPSSPTGLRVALGTTNTADTLVTAFPDMVTQLDGLDGFSTLAGVSMTFDGPLDVRGIADDPTADPPLTDVPADPEAYQKPDAPMFLVDVDPSSPDEGSLVGLVPKYWAQDADGGDFLADYTLVAQPAVPLREKNRYLFVATSRLHAKSGGAVTASADTQRITSGAPADDYEKKVQDALGVFEASTGVARSDVVLATVFTTESVTPELAATAAYARTQPAPALGDPWTVETPLQAAPDNRIRFRATFQTPEYRAPDTGKWQIQDGRPVQQATVPLEVFLAFSDGTISGPRPIVIFQHGLGSDKDATWGTTAASRRLGVRGHRHRLARARLARDAAVPARPDRLVKRHPRRSSASTSTKARSTSASRATTSGRWRATSSSSCASSDRSARSTCFRSARRTACRISIVSRILYLGQSFGSVQGPTIFALAPEITQAVWNVGGAGLTVLLRDSPLFSLALGGLEPPGTTKGALARFFVVAAALVDRGDPDAYAPYATLRPLDGVTNWTPRDAIIQEVVNDSIVPNSSAEMLARAAGLAHMGDIAHIPGTPVLPPPVTGNLHAGNTGVISQFDRINGTDVATHGELLFAPEAIQQYVTFFETGLASAHATAVSPY